MIYRLLAAIVVVIHFAFVAYIAVGLGLILLGAVCRWSWIRNCWFRLTHLLAILIVVFEMIFGIWCPLTVWEDELRRRAGVPVEQAGFIERQLERLLFETVPVQLLDTIYWSVGGLTVALLLIVPPRWRRRGGKPTAIVAPPAGARQPKRAKT